MAAATAGRGAGGVKLMQPMRLCVDIDGLDKDEIRAHQYYGTTYFGLMRVYFQMISQFMSVLAPEETLFSSIAPEGWRESRLVELFSYQLDVRDDDRVAHSVQIMVSGMPIEELGDEGSVTMYTLPHIKKTATDGTVTDMQTVSRLQAIVLAARVLSINLLRDGRVFNLLSLYFTPPAFLALMQMPAAASSATVQGSYPDQDALKPILVGTGDQMRPSIKTINIRGLSSASLNSVAEAIEKGGKWTLNPTVNREVIVDISKNFGAGKGGKFLSAVDTLFCPPDGLDEATLCRLEQTDISLYNEENELAFTYRIIVDGLPIDVIREDSEIVGYSVTDPSRSEGECGKTILLPDRNSAIMTAAKVARLKIVFNASRATALIGRMYLNAKRSGIDFDAPLSIRETSEASNRAANTKKLQRLIARQALLLAKSKRDAAAKK